MPTLPAISGAAFARPDEWNAMNESVDDVLFKVAGVVLAIATLGVAYVHYRHLLRDSGGDAGEASVEAPARAHEHHHVESEGASGEAVAVIASPTEVPVVLPRPRYNEEVAEVLETRE